MKAAVIASTLIGAAIAAPQGVTDPISPEGEAPAGCTKDFDGKFEITVAQVTKEKRDNTIQRRADCGANGALVMTLKDGATYDGQDRTGYIASNYQFQFDGPPQAGAIYTSGFSVCDDSILALGSNTTFYRCLSGDFYNLYNVNWAAQCSPVSIIALPCGGSEDSAGQKGDGQVVGTTVVQTTIVTALHDGQPQVITTAVPVPVTSYYPTSAPVSQISDGQIQVPPPQTPTSVATGTAPIPTTAAPSPPATGTGAAPSPAPTTAAPSPSGSASAPASAPASSASSVVTSKATSAASSATKSSASAPAATTSAPAQNGSTRTTASLAALVVAFVAFACL